MSAPSLGQPGRRDGSCWLAPHPPPSRPQPPCPGPLAACNYPQYWLYGLLEMGDQAARGSSLKGTQESFQCPPTHTHTHTRGAARGAVQVAPLMPGLHTPSPAPRPSLTGPGCTHTPCQPALSGSPGTTYRLLPVASKSLCGLGSASPLSAPRPPPFPVTPPTGPEPPQMPVPLPGTLNPPFSAHPP